MIFSRADAIICVSEYEKGLVESDFNVKEKTITIPNGLNLSEFENLKRQKNENKEKILLYVGRLEEYKGVQYIIQSLPELQDFRLRIVGKGPYEDELHGIAERIGVAKRIEWLKGISRRELLECYADADVFLMLSSHEAYGITVAEALASGTLCMVVKGSALEEFVDGINCIGIEWPPTKEKIIRVLQGMEKVKKQKNSGKKKGLIDWNEIVDKIGEIYLKK
jgi:glycosyltransferase involved in cell wall biosynthesis